MAGRVDSTQRHTKATARESAETTRTVTCAGTRPPVRERGPAPGLRANVPLSGSSTGSSRALDEGTGQSGSHSVRPWRQRRREDEQQVRRVSDAWPPPGPLPPNRSPGPLPPGPGAHSAEPLAPGPPGPEPPCARGPDGAGRARPRSPGPLSRRTPARRGPGEGRPHRPEGDFFSDAPPWWVRAAGGVEGRDLGASVVSAALLPSL